MASQPPEAPIFTLLALSIARFQIAPPAFLTTSFPMFEYSRGYNSRFKIFRLNSFFQIYYTWSQMIPFSIFIKLHLLSSQLYLCKPNWQILILIVQVTK